jgi:hypothetical protein
MWLHGPVTATLDTRVFGNPDAPPGTVLWIVRLDKLLVACGFADSATDGARKIKARAVKIDDEVVQHPKVAVATPLDVVIRVGRLLKKVTIQ